MEQVSTLTDVIVGVTPRVVTRKRDNQQITLYEVELGNGIKATAARRETGQAAMALVGQTATVTIKTEENGQYRNNYLQAVGPVQSSTPVGQQMQQAQQAWVQNHPVNQPQVSTATAQAMQPYYNSQPNGPTDKDTSIWRQCATKVAARLSKTGDEFWQNVDMLMDYYQHGTKPGVAFTAVAEPQQAGNQFIQDSQSPYSDGRPLPSDDDIPF